MPDSANPLADILIAYAAACRRDRAANPGKVAEGSGLEQLLAPHFKAMLERVLALLHGEGNPGPQVLAEYGKPGIGRPDIALARPGQSAWAFVELKEPGKPLEPGRLRGHDAAQFARFRELPVWGFCNFHTLHLYRQGELSESAQVVPELALAPETSDGVADRAIRKVDTRALRLVVQALALARPVAPKDGKELAEMLARAARLARAVVLDTCREGAPPALAAVQAEFRETLFAHPEAAGFDTSDEDLLFATAFGQTLAFGLLLACEARHARNAQQARANTAHAPAPIDVDRDAYQLLPEGGYPLLRAALRVLTQDEILEILGAAFDVLRDCVNVVDPALLKPVQGRDPILYFYEDFLAVFDEAAVRRHGVFYTPVPVVRFMVAATDRALRALGTQGLRDGGVQLLDPACGTGTFLVAALDHAASRVAHEESAASVPAELADLAARLFGFELLVGPYTVAHYRLQHELAARGAMQARRLPVYLADTLTPPAEGRGTVGRFAYMSAAIVEERNAADAVKRDTPILAIIGNPPYRRLEQGEEARITAGWANGFWDDLKQPVRDAGWGGELNTFPDLYIAFWRWSLWKLFECDGAPKRGVVCLITNRTFLAGHPYAGLRRMLRERFDHIEIIDLRGDSQGARPAGITEDENVFAVRVGVCIVVAVATGQKEAGAFAAVRQADVWRQGAFTATQKLAVLEGATADPAALDLVPIARGALDDFAPVPFAGRDWPVLSEVFAFRSSGMQTKRDDFVYAISRTALEARVRAFTDGAIDDEAFAPTLYRTAEVARKAQVDPAAFVVTSYRPLDRRSLYLKREFIDRDRPDLGAAWGAENVCLYAMPSGTGVGPAVWVHGLKPDYHAFRGSYGGYAFPLFDRRRGADAHNLNQALLDGLAGAHGTPVAPQDLFDAIAALLSAPSYSRRFAFDLEEVFAHLPLPADPATFRDAARIGAEIRALETFARQPDARFRTAQLAGSAAPGAALSVGTLARAFIETGDGRGRIGLVGAGDLALTGVSARAWAFEVSGYRVMHKWLAARTGEPWEIGLQRGVLDLAWRVEELLHWFDQADPVLAQAVAKPLTRAALGL